MEYNFWKTVLLDWVSVKKVYIIMYACVVIFFPQFCLRMHYTENNALFILCCCYHFEVNSTGFLVQNYENLGDTNIEIFFEAFKKQIKSTTIKSKNVISFVEGM